MRRLLLATSIIALTTTCAFAQSYPAPASNFGGEDQYIMRQYGDNDYADKGTSNPYDNRYSNYQDDYSQPTRQYNNDDQRNQDGSPGFSQRMWGNQQSY